MYLIYSSLFRCIDFGHIAVTFASCLTDHTILSLLIFALARSEVLLEN